MRNMKIAYFIFTRVFLILHAIDTSIELVYGRWISNTLIFVIAFS